MQKLREKILFLVWVMIFWNSRFACKWPKRQNFQNPYYTPNLWNTTQGRYIPSFKSLACLLFDQWKYLLRVFSIRIYLRFCTYSHILYLQANRYFQKIISQARNNISFVWFFAFLTSQLWWPSRSRSTILMAEAEAESWAEVKSNIFIIYKIYQALLTINRPKDY